MTILLIEDDKNIASFIQQGLEDESYAVDIAHKGNDGYQMAMSQPYHLIILDLLLPDINGKDLCKRLREAGLKTPVLMLTGLNSVADKVGGFESGADDYLTKPFAFSEMLARIKALLRRAQEYENELFAGDLRIDLLSRRVFRNDKEIILTPKEFSLLEYLVKNKNTILSRAQIIENIWGYRFEPITNIVDVHIKFLREKIDRGFPRRLIYTVRGTGYILKAHDET